MARGEFLLEVRAEEIPARMLPAATRELGSRLFEELMTRGVVPRAVEAGFTSRRLWVVLRGLAAREPDREEDVMGPPLQAALREGQPTEAAAGFARRCEKPVDGLLVVEAKGGKVERTRGTLEDFLRSAPGTDLKGLYLADRRKIAGRSTAELLADLAPRAVMGIAWPKTMRWAHATGPWVRPLHGIVALFDGEVVPFECFGVASGDATIGHPVLSPKFFRVRDAAGHRRKLRSRSIEPVVEERRSRLHQAMVERAAALGGRLVEDDALLDKLAAICEIPGMLEGRLREEHLSLPREVLQTSLRDHQSAFAVEDPGTGRLMPVFLTVMDRSDDPLGRVRDGNEWVVAARLEDARFFYGENRKRPLVDRREGLERLTFQEVLGSYADKTRRLESLTGLLAQHLGLHEARADAQRAAGLLKCDLATEMVKEFTSLQGVMGGIYAREDGEPEAVWQAIYDQYLPAATGDALPRGPAGLVVGVADRLDSLAGLFGLGLIPTGSRDPFGLRRAAQGVVRILLERDLHLDLAAAAREALALFGDRRKRPIEESVTALRAFFADRVRYLLGLEGLAHDEIEAALAAAPDDPAAVRGRARALHALRGEADLLAVVRAAKRIENLLASVESGAGDSVGGEDSTRTAGVEPEEDGLRRHLASLREPVAEASASGDFEAALRAIATIGPALDRFFTEVLVMDPDPVVRSRRLALLARCRDLIAPIARLQELVIVERR